MSHIIAPQHQASSARQGALGTNAKSSSPCTPTKEQNLYDFQPVRADRYAVQNVIRKRLLGSSDFDPDSPDWDLYNSLPRVVKCRRARVAPTVDIRSDQAKGQCHYSGLTACGSVWACPICCAQIQEQRRQEISQTMTWAYNQGYKVMMVTFTAPHYRADKCQDLLTSFAAALKYFRSGKVYQRFKSEIDQVGIIRSLETRYGGNGWHNHTHELWIVKNTAQDPEHLKTQILDRWRKACDKQGMIPRGKIRAFLKHAVDVQDNVDTSDYLAKQDSVGNLTWGGDREITKHLSKSGRGSVHPFQLAQGSPVDFDLFQEYLDAFKGRASVYFSPGLKKKAGLLDVSDQELADQEPGEVIEDVASLDSHGWNQVLHENARAEILQLAESEGAPGVESWLRIRGISTVNKALVTLGVEDPLLVNLHEYPD